MLLLLTHIKFFRQNKLNAMFLLLTQHKLETYVLNMEKYIELNDNNLVHNTSNNILYDNYNNDKNNNNWIEEGGISKILCI